MTSVLTSNKSQVVTSLIRTMFNKKKCLREIKTIMMNFLAAKRSAEVKSVMALYQNNN